MTDTTSQPSTHVDTATHSIGDTVTLHDNMDTWTITRLLPDALYVVRNERDEERVIGEEQIEETQPVHDTRAAIATLVQAWHTLDATVPEMTHHTKHWNAVREAVEALRDCGVERERQETGA